MPGTGKGENKANTVSAHMELRKALTDLQSDGYLKDEAETTMFEYNDSRAQYGRLGNASLRKEHLN